MEATIESLDYKRGVVLGLGGMQRGAPGSNAPKVMIRLRVEAGFSRTVEQNIYWTLTNVLKGRTIDERTIVNLAHDLVGEKVEVKRDGGGNIYISQDSLEELLRSRL